VTTLVSVLLRSVIAARAAPKSISTGVPSARR